MRKTICLPIFALLVAAGAPPCGAVPLAEGGRALCAIETPEAADETEGLAAEELAGFLGKISGASFAVRTEGGDPTGCVLSVGNTRLNRSLISPEDRAWMGEEGFFVKTRNDGVSIFGAFPRGTLYGVYSFLEDDLGVRWYAPGAERIPKTARLKTGDIDRRDRPAYEYRESFFHHAFNGEWAARNRVNGGHHRLNERQGGGVEYHGGFVHTFSSLVPADVHWDAHPEYFAEIDGVRRRDGQLCLTNPDVLRIVQGRVRELAESAGEKRVVISVSQDDHQRYCQCPLCRKIDAEEGSNAGTLLRFVNAIADSIASEFPNVLVDTLAYQYTEVPPKRERPRPNVIVRLCHMAPSCDFHPLGKCFWNENYVRNLKGWSKITDRLYVWHYVTNFAHYLAPFPDLNAIVKDMKFYRDHSVRGLFAQGSYQSGGGDMAELKAWLIAKLLWNPDADAESLIDDFIGGYYGKAAPAMRKYIYVQRKRVKGQKWHGNLFSPPSAGYLDPELLAAMASALGEAETLAAGDPILLGRIQKHRLSIEYIRLATPSVFFSGYDPSRHDWEEHRIRLGKFGDDLRSAGVDKLEEWRSLDGSLKVLEERIPAVAP